MIEKEKVTKLKNIVAYNLEKEYKKFKEYLYSKK